MTVNNRTIKITFLISFFGHYLLLGMPLFNIETSQANQPEEITVKVEIEHPRLLPKIERLGEEKKLKKIEKTEKKNQPEEELKPQIIEKVVENFEPKIEKIIEETVVVKKLYQPINEENIEILKPDDEAIFRYQDMVKQKIESHRHYPRRAKKQKFEGVVYVTFVILSNGEAKDIVVRHSSGLNILDREAVATINRAAPFLPIPKNIHNSFFEMDVSIVFKLS